MQPATALTGYGGVLAESTVAGFGATSGAGPVRSEAGSVDSRIIWHVIAPSIKWVF